MENFASPCTKSSPDEERKDTVMVILSTYFAGIGIIGRRGKRRQALKYEVEKIIMTPAFKENDRFHVGDDFNGGRSWCCAQESHGAGEGWVEAGGDLSGVSPMPGDVQPRLNRAPLYEIVIGDAGSVSCRLP